MPETIPGQLVVVSGPSGVGKSTVVREVLKRFEGSLRMSVSATTRPPREGESDGIHYHFLSKEDFAERRAGGQFLECAEVFGRGHWYGTLWSEVTPSLRSGDWVLLEIDVQGAQEVLEQYPEAVSIFIRCESLSELERRLRQRGTETEEAIARRLAVAEEELRVASRYRYQVVNRTVPEAVDSMCDILHSEGLKE